MQIARTFVILKSKMRLLPQSALFLFSVAALQLPAQTKPEAPQAPVTVEPGLEKAVEWKWWPVASDPKNWRAPAPEAAVQATPSGAPGPNGAATPGALEPRPREYEVKRGDALVLIGKKFGISGQQLKEFNGLTKDTIQIGQVLKIPTIEEVMAMTPAPPPPTAKAKEKQKQEEAQGQLQSGRTPMLPPGQEDLLMQIYLDREGYSCGSIDGNAGPLFSKVLQLYRDNHSEFIDMTALKDKALEVVGSPLTGYVLKPEDFRFIEKPAPSPTPTRKKNSKTSTKDEVEPLITYQELLAAPLLVYRTPWEFVAERYHCDEIFLRNLNPRLKNPEPGAAFQVPNVIPFEIEKAFESDAPLQPAVDEANPVTVSLVELSRLEVSRGGKLIALAPVGFARPGLRGLGSWTIHEAIPHPKLATLQELREAPKPASPTVIIESSGATPAPGAAVPPAATPPITTARAVLSTEQFLADGPNNPVGLVWLGLSKTKTKEALPYGLHGTSIPRRIKSQEGIGGIRLTNWDIMRIVRLIPAGTPMQWK
ncbi:MAG: LysM peptidoglycan-binding domain-containing protein [Roseimicrobium sp.]